MAHTLTWNANAIDHINVNGITVSQPYTLQDGDVIEVYALRYSDYWCTVSDSDGGTMLANSIEDNTCSLSDTDLYINYLSHGGGSN